MGVSENNRKAKFYSLTRAGRKQVERAAREWDKATAILARFTRMLQGQRDMKTVAQMVLSELAPLVDAQQGVFGPPAGKDQIMFQESRVE